MRIAVTAYFLDSYTDRCLADLVESGLPVTVYDDANQLSTMKLAAKHGVGYMALEPRRSVAEVWNTACRGVFSGRGQDESLLILNNDTWGFTGLADLADYCDASDYGVYFGLRDEPCWGVHGEPTWFSAFAIKKWVYEKVGAFDEGYRVAMVEDDDYMMRLIQEDIPCCLFRPFHLFHAGAATLYEISDEEMKQRERWRAVNESRFERKWHVPPFSQQQRRLYPKRFDEVDEK